MKNILKLTNRLLSIALTAALALGLLPALPPGVLPPTIVLAEEPPAPERPRTIFANIGPGGFNEGNTSRALLDPNKTMFINGNTANGGKLGADGSIILTDNAGSITGSAFLSRRIYSETGFSARFEMVLGAKSPNAADGWAFIVAKDTNKLGESGGSMGYNGIPNSFAFVYDTYYNGGRNNDTNYVPRVQKATNGSYAENIGDSVLAFPASAGRGGAANYSVYGWVDYDSKAGTMSLYLSLAPGAGDLEKPAAPISVFEGIDIEAVLGNQYYIGFTAATGASWQNMRLRQFYVFNEYAPDIDFNAKGDDIVIPGGGEGESGELIEDFTPPSAPNITQSSNGMTDELMVFSIGGSEDLNGVKKYQYRIGGDEIWRNYAYPPASENFVLDGSQLITTAITPGGSATVYARALDFGGNISDETSATLKYTIAPGPSMTTPSDKAANIFPANVLALVISFKSKIKTSAETPGTVNVAAEGGIVANFRDGEIKVEDARWDPSQSMLTLPFATDGTGLDYGRTYTVTVSGFENTSNIKMGDKDSSETETFTFSTIGQETMPNAKIDYANERLTGLTSDVVYKINGTEYTAENGGIDISVAWLGTTVRIVKPGTDKTVDSEAQPLWIPVRRNAPAVASIPGHITGATTAMQYRSGTGTWLDIPVDGDFMVVDGTYSVRYKSTDSNFAGTAATVNVAEMTYTLNADDVSFDTISSGAPQPDAQKIIIHSSGNTAAAISGVTSSDDTKFKIIGSGDTVPVGGSIETWTVQPVYDLHVGVYTEMITVTYDNNATATAQVSLTVREATPDIQIDYANDQLINLTPGATYTVNGNSQTASTGRLNIDSAWFGAKLTIVKTNANTALNSFSQTLTIPARGAPPETPGTVAATDETYASEKDGTLIGVTTDMEYRRVGAEKWTTGDGNPIPNLAPSEYQVRYKAVVAGEESKFHSRAVQLNIAASRNYKVTAEVSADPSGMSGKVNTGYLLVTFAHANPANSAVTIMGFDNTAFASGNGNITNISGVIGHIEADGANTWRVPFLPASNDVQVTLTLPGSWTASGNTYTVTGTKTAEFTAYLAVPEDTPDATIDYANERLTGLKSGSLYKLSTLSTMERTADDNGYILLSGFIPDAIHADTTIDLIKSGDATHVDSAAQTITIPKRPATPILAVTQPESNSGKGSIEITNPVSNASYAYRLSSATAGTAWTPVVAATVTGIDPEAYYIRVLAGENSFRSENAHFRIHAYNEVRFESVLRGYTVDEGDVSYLNARTQPVTSDTDITGVVWATAEGVEISEQPAIDALPFTLTGSGDDWTITPKDGLMPNVVDELGPQEHTAYINVKHGGDQPETQTVAITVYNKAEISSAVASSKAGEGGLTDTLTLTFAQPIPLAWGDLHVEGGAVKSGADFTDVEKPDLRDTYTLAVTPNMSHKTGDAIMVSIDLTSENLKPYYEYQASKTHKDLTDATARVSIPRAIKSATAYTFFPGFSTEYIMVTLDHENGNNPIDTDAIEERIYGEPDHTYSGSIEITVGDEKIEPAYIYRIDNDMGYTFCPYFILEPSKAISGAATISIPGFGITEPFKVSGDIVTGTKTFTEEGYVLDAQGHNYKNDLTGHQILDEIVFDPSGTNHVYAATDYVLHLNQEYNDFKVQTVYIDGKEYPGFTAENGGNMKQIFDYKDNLEAYPELEKHIKLTLKDGWTDTNGEHSIRIVLQAKDGKYWAIRATVAVSGLTPTYALSVENGSGAGKYPADVQIPITGNFSDPNAAFLGWTQNADDTAQIALPAEYGGTITMPAAEVHLTAHYADRAARPAVSINYADATLALTAGTYSFNAGSPVEVTGGTYPIDEAWFGKTLTVRSVEDVAYGDSGAKARVDSEPNNVDIPMRGGAPGATGEDEKFNGLGGKLKYVTDQMEYSSDDGAIWTSVPAGATELTVEPGDYLVRYKAKPNAFASGSVALEIAASTIDPVWSVSVTPETVEFPAAAYGYTSSAASSVTVTVTNTGNQPTGELTIEMTGDTDSFILLDTTLAGIPVGGTAQFTVEPKSGLAPKDSYMANIKADGATPGSWTFMPDSASVSFKVTSAEISGFDHPATVRAGTPDTLTDIIHADYENFGDATKVAGQLIALYPKVKAHYAGGPPEGVDVTVDHWQEKTATSYTVTAVGEYVFEAVLVTPLPDNLANQADLTATVIVKIDDVLYGITPDKNGHAFPDAKFGYEQPTSQTIIITNIGTNATGNLKAELDSADFVLSTDTVPTIEIGGSDTATLSVRPASGLAPESGGSPKTYTATLTISGNETENAGLVEKKYNLSFTVSPNDITGFAPIDAIAVDYNADDASGIASLLPSAATAMLANPTPFEVPVSWSCSEYDRTAPGDYTFTGTLNFGTLLDDGNCSNPQNFTTVTARVTVREPVNAERPVIAVDPVSYSGIAGGENITLTVELKALEQTGGTVTGKWLYGSTNAYAGEDIQGATDLELTVPTGGAGTLYYWYEVTHTNNAGYITGETSVTARSEIAAVTLRHPTLTVVNGTINSTGATTGEFAAGATVTVTAAAPPQGQIFSAWTQTAATAITLPAGSSGTITMPAADVTLTATYRTPSYIPPTPTPTPTPEPEADPESTPDPTPAPTPTPPTDASTIFVDVREDDWFNDDVSFVYELGLMLGTGDDTFSPQTPITRGMAVTILHRLYILTAGNAALGVPSAPGAAFTDVPADTWYTEAVAWAVSEGIVLGVGGGRFEPDRAITRQEMTTILYRYANTIGGLPEDPGGEGYSVFADADAVSDWARDSATWAADTGIVTGKPGNIFDPRGVTTRAEIAALLKRAIDN